MSLFNRQTLKNFFKKGNLPSEVHFSYLIDSVVNKVDDGFAKTETGGLQLSPTGESARIISIYEQLSDADALWSFNIDKQATQEGLKITNQAGQSQLYFKDNGNVGVHTDTPNHNFEVGGTLGYQTRIGTYKKGEIIGDGKWQTILSTKELKSMGVFEVVAHINKPHEINKTSPAAAFIRATAMHTYDRGKIQKTRVQFGFPAFCYRLCLRWHGSGDRFNLQLKSWWNYGEDEQGKNYPIHYHIGQLWE